MDLTGKAARDNEVVERFGYFYSTILMKAVSFFDKRFLGAGGFEGWKVGVFVFLGLSVGLMAGGVNIKPVEGPIYDPIGRVNLYVVPIANAAQAEEEARALGGHLATIGSAAENEFIVKNVLLDLSGSGGPNLSQLPLWIGLYDPTGMKVDDAAGGVGVDSPHAANFRWMDGSTATYRNWNVPTREPNDDHTRENGEYNTVINWHRAEGSAGPGTWNDEGDTGSRGFAGHTDGPYYGIVAVPMKTGTAGVTGTAGGQ